LILFGLIKGDIHADTKNISFSFAEKLVYFFLREKKIHIMILDFISPTLLFLSLRGKTAWCQQVSSPGSVLIVSSSSIKD
jgi:hypothetical protein